MSTRVATNTLRALGMLIAITTISMAPIGSTMGAPAALEGVGAGSSALPSASVGIRSRIPREVSCMRAYVKDPSHHFTNYAPAIGAPEVTDAIHSGLQPCATFTGSVRRRIRLRNSIRRRCIPVAFRL